MHRVFPPLHERFAAFLRLACAALAATLLLGGCATTVRSDVTVFHDWAAAPQEKTFAFDPASAHPDDPTYGAIEDMVRIALGQLGFDGAKPATAAMRVKLQYGMTARDMTVVESAPDPALYGSPWYGPPFGLYGRYGYYGFASPFWMDQWSYAPRTERYTLYQRRLEVTILRAADGKKLWNGIVVSEGRNGDLLKVMPYMVRSLFRDFPGPNGASRRIDMKMD
ncbi:MAG: DUF4136 domain-containing protein [Burkholderiaceae bacterium]